MAVLAIHGGQPAKTTPFGTGKRFGEKELEYLREALDQNTLFYWNGQMTKRMLAKFADYVGTEYAASCSSGTASIHVALMAAGVTMGDEVITCSNTDQGTVCGILYQNAVPVFADVLPGSYLLDPADVEKRITERTKAIVVVHLTGNPCDMDAFCDLAKRHNLMLIEDCAQAYGCRFKGRMVGTFGHMGCFSLNEFKHINAGDGGVIVTNDQRLYEQCHDFADKCYSRLLSGQDRAQRQVWTLSPNYRITELQSAVALAQLEKVDAITSRRHELGERLREGIADLPGITPHQITPSGYCSYWFSGFTVESDAPATPAHYVDALQAEGIGSAHLGYFSLLKQGLFTQRNAYRGTHFPFEGGPHGVSYTDYNLDDFPNTAAMNSKWVFLSVNEFYTDQDLDETIAAIRKIHDWYASNPATA